MTMATLIKRLDGSRWQALVKPARKLKPGDMVRFGEEGQGESSVCFLGQLDATVEAKGEAGEVTLGFSFHGPVLDQAIAERGEMPLPPYIASRRVADARDRIDYQTMFAREEGAVAAPTAGLHFTESLMAELAARGIGLHTVTLHVGAGTFLPVKADDVVGHKMHAEWGQVTAEVAAALNAARAPLGARASRPPLKAVQLPRRWVLLKERAGRPRSKTVPLARRQILLKERARRPRSRHRSSSARRRARNEPAHRADPCAGA